MSEKKPPRTKTIEKWKELYPWLKFTNDMKMICTSCKSQEEKLKLMPSANLTFVNGSTNYKPSTLKDHAATECHKRAIREIEHEKAIEAGSSLQPRKIVQHLPSTSSIVQGFRRMGDNERVSS